MRALLSLTFLVAIIATPPLAYAQADLENGKQKYTLYCVTCHGETGDGQGIVGKTLDPPPRDFTVGWCWPTPFTMRRATSQMP